MKLKNILCAAFLSVAVAIVFCGCGNEKSQETGIEIKKISEEEVYELYAQVKQKREKIEEARLSMDQGFQEKWDLLKRKMDSADLALGKNNFDTASKFLQEAESAADWIMNRGPLRAEADEKYSELQSRKRESNGTDAPKYASTIYAEAEKYEQQGREAYEKIEFEKATRLYVLAANEYKKATSTASAFHAAVYEMNAAKEKADKEKASQFASTIYQSALSQFQQAIKANAQGRYDEALQLLESAENKFENAAPTALQFTTAQQKANGAKEKADKEKASQFASTIYQSTLSQVLSAIKANAQGRYDEALQLLESAENKLENAVTAASRFTAAQQKANAAKEKADKESVVPSYASTLYQDAVAKIQPANDANAQGKYDEALQLLESAVETFEKAEKEACKKALSNLVKSFVKIEEENYYIGKYEVTQAQWKAVMGNNPARFKGADRPVECVSWDNAMHFCDKLNDMGLAPAGYEFSLPTRAQWEYAARGGNKSKGYEYSGSNDINEVAWYGKISGGQTHPVGEKKPNELGLYDMSGNVREWCLDAYKAPHSIPACVVRGGYWDSGDYSCRVVSQVSGANLLYGDAGFRLALVPAN